MILLCFVFGEPDTNSNYMWYSADNLSLNSFTMPLLSYNN